MRKSLWSILPIIVLVQAILAVPLPDIEGVNEPVSLYQQKVRDLVQQSENMVNEVYEGLPQLHRDFDNYLSMLRDFKSMSSNTAALTNDMLKSWFNLLALIKAEMAESYEGAPTTQEYSKESFSHSYAKGEAESISEEEGRTIEFSTSEEQITTTEESYSVYDDSPFNDLLIDEEKNMLTSPKILYLHRTLHNLKYNSMALDDSKKAYALLDAMITWDEKCDSDTFKEEVLALSVGTVLKNETNSKFLIEYRRLNNLYMQMIKWNESNQAQFIIQLLKLYLNAFSFETVEKFN